MIAEYEKAKIAERYRRGKLFRARAGEIITWKTAYGYRRIARSAADRPGAPARSTNPKPPWCGGSSPTGPPASPCARSAAGSTPTRCPPRPAKPTWGTLHPAAGCCATRPTSAGSTSTAPNRCPTGAPPAATARSRATATNGSRSTAPASSPTSCSRPPPASPPTTPSGARAAPNPAQWLLKGLVKCGVCGVGTNCHKMRGRNGTWHRYYYCRNHDPLRAGGEDRRCPERNIRADALDAFVFDQIRAALTQPDHAAGRRTSRRPHAPRSPTTNCSPPNSPAWTARSTPPTAERRRLVDLYQAGLIELPELQRRATEVAARRTRPAAQTHQPRRRTNRARPRQPAPPPRPRLRRPHPRRHRPPRRHPKTAAAAPAHRRRPRHRLARPDPAAHRPRPARPRPRPARDPADPTPRRPATAPGVKPRRFAFRW